MASHFKWYPAESEVVVPFNARYSFPSQSNKAIKMTPRIPPKNASEFAPGQVVRLEFPAQGYINPAKTTLEFDVILQYTGASGDTGHIRFQNNIQSIFSRVRLLYGATPLEDIPYYNCIVRCLTEWTATNQQGSFDQTSINEGIGGCTTGFSSRGTATTTFALAQAAGGLAKCDVNVREAYIQGYNFVNTATPPAVVGSGVVPNATTPAVAALGSNVTYAGNNPQRRYQVQLALGLFNQEKLIPTKFMASQLVIELTLANPADCIYATGTLANSATLSYQVKNVNLIPEILEFDASYDESFLRGLQSGGVPIKFSTWNQYRFSNGAGQNVNLQIQERSRSVKAIFAMQRRSNPTLTVDNGACFFNTDITKAPILTNAAAASGSTFQEYQYRIGGRYFPAQAVQNSTEVGGAIPNSGAESWIEMSKALNVIGDYRLSSSINTTRWAIGAGGVYAADLTATKTITATILPEFDYDYSIVGFTAGGVPILYAVHTDTNGASGTMGSACFGMAIDLETSNGLEISGLNAEEQSDISLIARWSNNQTSDFVYDVFTYIDSMIVLRENNVMSLLTLGIGTHSVNCMLIIKMGDYGLNNSFEYVEMVVDSWDASASGNTTFENSTSNNNLIKYSWPAYYFTSKNLVVAGMKIIQAEIPFVFDTVTPANNTFTFTNIGVPTTITIPVGTYDGTTLATQLQTLLAAVSAGFLVTYSSTTLKFTFTYAGGAFTWGFIFPAGQNSAYSLMGFLPSSTTTFFGNGAIVSPTVAQVTGPYYLYVNSRRIGSIINFNLPDGAVSGIGPEICRIPVNVNFGSVIFYNDPCPEKFFDFFIGNQFNSFDFYLTLGRDQYQKPLDMKGTPWSMKIGLLCYRDATSNLYQKPASMARGSNGVTRIQY